MGFGNSREYGMHTDREGGLPSCTATIMVGRPTVRWLATAVVVGLVLQILLLHRSFTTKPSSDDFGAPYTEIHRGNREGWRSLVMRSAQAERYRPLTSLSIWGTAQFSGTEQGPLMFAIRTLHFLAMAAFATVVAVWIRTVGLSKPAAAAALAVAFLHPIIAPHVGNNGFDSLLCMAAAWLGVWCVWRFRNRLWVGVGLLLPCYAVAMGFKEYAAMVVPVAPWIVWRCSDRRPALKAVVVGCILAGITLFYLEARRGIPGMNPRGSTGEFALSPLRWLTNEAMMTVSVLFPGNTATIATAEGKFRFVVLFGLVSVVTAWLALGLYWEMRSSSRATALLQPMTWVGALFLAAVPGNLLNHVSEWYVIGMLLPLVILTGLAVEGYCASPAPWRRASFSTGLVLLAIMAVSLHDKVSAVHASGERAEVILQALLAKLPADAENIAVTVVFDLRQTGKQPAYSVFAVPDHGALAQPTFEWAKPGREMTLDIVATNDPASVDTRESDYVLQWDAEKLNFAIEKQPNP